MRMEHDCGPNCTVPSVHFMAEALLRDALISMRVVVVAPDGAPPFFFPAHQKW